ncbi:MAG: hypothetical protein CMG71_07355 [Candidatus Marinimicrobia bacterium]|nr:hypothetical protein [Candidatus Neomarinimicrobiota bacterium]
MYTNTTDPRPAVERNLWFAVTEPLFHRDRDCPIGNIGPEAGGRIKRIEVTNLTYRGRRNIRKRLKAIGHSNAIYIYSDTYAPPNPKHLRPKPLDYFVGVPHLQCGDLAGGNYIPLFSGTGAGSTSRTSASYYYKDDE